MGKKKKQIPVTVLLVMVFMIGLSLLLYPSISNYVNQLNGSKTIGDYSEAVSRISEEDYRKLLREAQEYNRALLQRQNGYVLDDALKKQYSQLLDINDNGVMGYIEIPSIEVNLPVYHGTEDRVLQIAAGHLEWTSLPIGGESTHCVLSGHRGLPSAKLFTNLDKLAEGDVFLLRVLNEVLTYEVDQILIVEPNDSKALQIEKGQDYCTLVTCTPYGINSHRLLVRGHRIENAEGAARIRITAEAMQIEPLLVAPIMAIPILAVLLVLLMSQETSKRKPKKHGGNHHE